MTSPFSEYYLGLNSVQLASPSDGPLDEAVQENTYRRYEQRDSSKKDTRFAIRQLLTSRA